MTILKLSQLSFAVIAFFSTSMTYAAGLERSQQPMSPFFEKGNYAEISYIYIKPDIKSIDITGRKVDNMMQAHSMEGATVKVTPTKNSALAIMYNKPWGVDTFYPKNNLFHNSLGATQSHVEAENLGLIVGGRPDNSNFAIYGGIEYQTVSGHVKAATPLGDSSSAIATEIALQKLQISPKEYAKLIQIQESSQSSLTNAEQTKLNQVHKIVENLSPSLATSPTMYSLDISNEHTVVPVVGIAFEKPEIALRSAITYRAPAKYNTKSKESIVNDTTIQGVGKIPLIEEQVGITSFEFPQSIAVDFQTGLSEKHQLLGTINARWVDWSKFKVAPPVMNELQGEPLAEYAKDQYSVEVALAKQFTPKLAGEVKVIYDSGTGMPLSLLGPYDSIVGLGLGAKYKFTDHLEVSTGAQYLNIEGGVVPSSNPSKALLKVDDSKGYAAGIKIGYHF